LEPVGKNQTNRRSANPSEAFLNVGDAILANRMIAERFEMNLVSLCLFAIQQRLT
jgi:hypothetical protein